MNKIELLEQMRILGDIRQRLGADDEDDTSKDKLIERMDARTLVATYYGWELGDDSWGYNIIDLFLELQSCMPTSNNPSDVELDPPLDLEDSDWIGDMGDV